MAFSDRLPKIAKAVAWQLFSFNKNIIHILSGFCFRMESSAVMEPYTDKKVLPDRIKKNTSSGRRHQSFARSFTNRINRIKLLPDKRLKQNKSVFRARPEQRRTHKSSGSVLKIYIGCRMGPIQKLPISLHLLPKPRSTPTPNC